MIVAVIDGMGGGIGSLVIENLRNELPSYCEIYGLGTNAIATSSMLKKGANKGATGENAIRVSIKKADVVIGPVSIVIPDSMMGEVTPSIAKSVTECDGYKILIPITPENFDIVGVENKPLLLLIKDVATLLKQELNIK